MTQPVSLVRHGSIAALRIDNPPVNAISTAVIGGLVAAVDAFEADRSLVALIVYGEGRTFVAGADIRAFDDSGFSAAPYNRLLARLEAQDRPVVAVLHGTALGGGLELGLACHYRVGLSGTRFGFPEVKLGLLPGSLGTQRLPRLIGPAAALDLIGSGRLIDADAALQVGLIDELRSGTPLAVGLTFAEALAMRGAQPRRLSEQRVSMTGLPRDFFARALEQAQRTKSFYPAARSIVQAVQAAALPFAEGEAIEARLFEELRRSEQSKALRHLFLAEREAAKIPGLPKDIASRTVRSVGVVGVGRIGASIAMSFANADIPVVLVEVSRPALERGLGIIRGSYEASALLTVEQIERRLALLKGTLDDSALVDCDLVIEAVSEDVEVKKQVCARLGLVCKPGAIIATSTSMLDINVLADATARASDVIGMHFSSPTHTVRLLEVVRGAKTAPDVVATVVQLARAMKKVAVVTGVCYGFIGNRMADVYMREAEYLLMEGASPAQVDRAVEALGMTMGPCRMLDMAGIDVAAKAVIEREKAGRLPDKSYRALARRLYELGRFGAKTGAGYYRYEGFKQLIDPETMRIARDIAERHGIARRIDIGDAEIVERLLYPLINEAARILEEGIAYRPGDIDVVWTAGYGFPDHRGGPVFMGDRIGLPVIVERLAHYARTRGNSFDYWTPAGLLVDLAREGRRLSDWTAL
jgi:3-hydroxyacyl-CoA dehydrogenase